MKRIPVCLLLLLSLGCLNARSQEQQSPCLPEGIAFTSQEEIDQFPVSYPGCTVISGNVTIGGWTSSPILNLNGLSALTSIGGDLTIGNNMALQILSGLDHLTQVGGTLYIGSNYAMHGLIGLNNLSTVGKQLVIESNPSLYNLSGLENLISVGDSLLIFFNRISDISAFSKLISVGGSFRVVENTSLTSIAGIPALTTVNGDLVFQDNGTTEVTGFDNLTIVTGDFTVTESSLTVFDGFNRLSAIGGNLIFYHNDNLIAINGLNNLRTIAGDLQITSNYEYLSTISGPDSLTSIGGSLYVQQNNQLADLSWLSNLSSLGKGVYLSMNSSLTGIHGLSLLKSIHENLVIIDNPSFSDFSGLEGIDSVCGYLVIEYNDSLKNLNGLTGLRSVTGKIELTGNNSLHTLSGAGNLESVGGYLKVEDDNALTDLSGFDKLRSVGGDLILGNNLSLDLMTGLDSLKTIAGTLEIRNNSSLTGLEAIAGLHSGSLSGLTIRDNPQLSECSVKSICEYLASPGATADIQWNAKKCSNRKEIENICAGMHYYDFAFSGIVNSSHVCFDSIRIIDRSALWDTTRYWMDTTFSLLFMPGDTLLCIGYTSQSPFGVENIPGSQPGFALSPSCPNPASGTSRFSLSVPERGPVDFLITDLTGRSILTAGFALEKGNHSFRLILGNQGLCILTARWKGMTKSIKIVSGSPGNDCQVEYLGPCEPPPVLKAEMATSGISMRESGLIDIPDSSETFLIQFSAGMPCPGIASVTYEGKVYHTVQIFSQCWLKENLNAGTRIDGALKRSDNGVIGKYCYNNDETNCDKYGGLYTWQVMMQYLKGAGDICPPGWHVPSDEEWKVLEGAADTLLHIGDVTWDASGFRGFNAGTNLKSSTGWSSGNGPDINGFSGLPAGLHHPDGSFEGLGNSGRWWTYSHDAGYHNAWYRNLDGLHGESDRESAGIITESDALSVRCLKNQ